MKARTPIIAATIALAAGCAPVNEQVGLIDADPLPAFDPDAETVRVTASSTPSACAATSTRMVGRPTLPMWSSAFSTRFEKSW